MLARLQEDRKTIEQLWNDGCSAKVLLTRLSRLMDEYICTCFERVRAEAGLDSGVAFIALGGYGRSELFPYSDVDLMILYSPEYKEKIAEIADKVLYPLWDTGLEIGHGVRTVRESLEHAGEDFFFRVALLDGRFLCGDSELFAELQTAYRRKFIDGCRKSFVEEMKTRGDERRKRFGMHCYLLEPHLKEGRGGLRDVQSMFWTARVVFGLSSLDEIEAAGLLLPDERREFQKSVELLERLRICLHYINKRKNDRLYFELQADVAEAFGYSTDGRFLSVEAFMRDLYSHFDCISLVIDLFFDHVDEVLGLEIVTDVKDRLIEKGIEIRRGRLHLAADRQMVEKKPHIIVRLFLAMARTGLVPHYRTRKMVSSYVSLLQGRLLLSPRLNKPFLRILLEAKDVFNVLETMLESRVLTAIIPEFGGVVSLAQHDLYHIYTVDRHSLQTVTELRGVVEEFSQAASLVDSFEVLYMAALLHDVGKGRGQDHSEAGAEIVGRVGQRFGFSEDECADLSFLVFYHLFIPENALRRDLNDIAFIQHCAEIVGSVSRLAMLYLLSMADSRATGPSAWSDWKGALMNEMYLKVLAVIEHKPEDLAGDSFQEHVEQGVDWLREQLKQALAGKLMTFDPAVLPADYLLGFDVDVVLGHVGLYKEKYNLLRQKSHIEPKDMGGEWQILFMSLDRPGLLAKICGVLALHNLVVVKAQIFTWKDATAVDIVTVRPPDGLTFVEKDWRQLQDDVDLAIAHRIDIGGKLYQKWIAGYGRRYELTGNVESRIVIDNESSTTYSVVEVYAADRPYLLYRITQALADFGVNIHKAYIATEVEQLIDVFYVLDSRGEKLIDKSFQEKVVGCLMEFIDDSKKEK